jgi:hypothetical protein
MKKALYKISMEMLRTKLFGKENFEITNLVYDHRKDVVEIVITGESLPDKFTNKEGCNIEMAIPSLLRQ